MDFSVRPGALARLCWLLLLFLLPFALADVDDKYIKKTEFASKLSPFQFFEDSETVLVVEPDRGVAWKSEDAGASWDKLDEIEHAYAVIISPNHNDVAIIMCKGDTHYYTHNKGKKWHDFKVPRMLPSPGAPFSFHAGDKKKVIFNVVSKDGRGAYYTDDGFSSDPEKLRPDAKQCMWAREKTPFTSGSDKIDDNRVLCIVPKEGGIRGLLNEHLVYSDNYFKDEKEVQIGDGRGGGGFESMVSAKKYVMAAKKAKGTTEMAMYSTTNGEDWHRATFGQQSLESDGFTVMESTDYSIRVDVSEGGGGPFAPAPMGNLFASDSNGTQFSSLQRHTNRNLFGFVDYERLDNVQGIALTNIVANPEEALDRHDEKQLKTHITFDDGRTFKSLRGKRDDKEGDVHLHGYSEMRNQGKVYSNKGAPGLLMGIGNIGEDLHPYKECNLWISQDGGENWYFSGYEGPQKYEFADSGSVLVAVSDGIETDHIKYSLDYGRNWKKLSIVNEDDRKFQAGVFTTIMDSTSKKVLLTTLSGRGENAKLLVYSIDFSFLDLKKCKKSDFETWKAREVDGEAGCVMGQQQSFKRKKQDIECSVDKEFEEAEPDFKACDCSEADFECDTGYAMSKEGKKCLPDKGHAAPKGQCKNPKDTFKGPSGFRLIPGNACKKNDVYDKMMDDVERSCEDHETAPVADEIKSEITLWEGAMFREFRYLERPDFSDDDDETGGYFKDETILLLTENRDAWKTHDHGKNWKRISEIEEALFIYPNAHEHRDAYIITVSGDVWYTTNRGQHFKSFKAPNPPNSEGLPILRFHESQRDWLIWTGCESNRGPCNPSAHRSLKRGENWERLIDDAGACEFVWQEGRNTSEKLVFCAREDGRKKSLIASDDWFEADKHEIFDDIANFATMSEFIIVATREGSDQASLTLNASVDARNFAPARWPPSVAPSTHEGFDGYTVLDSSSHSIFLHITINPHREREYGTIVKSNSNGTNFVTSLDYVNRNSIGFVDFEKVQAIEGTALANVVANFKEVDDGSAKKIQTRMTHNDGADWNYLTPPSKDAEGKDIECVSARKRKEECALHLHGYTERRSPEDSYSSPSAVGLVMGIGNVGSELGKHRDGDTFISRDGGLTWDTAAQGQYLWEFGDQGSIIVLVEEKVPTNTILYSLNEGKSFTKWQFTDEEKEQYEITDISTVPSDGSLNFLLWGRKPSGKREAVTVNIDFRGAFERKCKFKGGEDEDDDSDSDYYLWEPQHPFQENNCLFGHRARYHRKKESSTDCYNGPRIDRLHDIKENCSCTAIDFECDYNYQRDNAGLCIRVGEERDPMDECRSNPGQKEYYPISGYRRIPGNTCEGGKIGEYLYDSQPCPGFEEEYSKKHGTSGWLVLFIVLVCGLGAAGIGYFVYQRFASGGFGRIALSGDDSGGGQTTRLRMPMPNFDTSSALVRYPVVAVSAVAAALMALPMIVVSGGKWIRDRFPGRSRGYSRLDGAPAWRGSGSRTYRSRDSFARGRDWTGQASDESDLLGEDSDEEA